MSVRIVDDAQYENRLRNWDYDMIVRTWGQALSPGNEQRDYLEFAGRRHAGLAQLRRHQESGGRCADRPHHLRQEPRRAGRRHQGARPRAAVEPLRRAAMDLRQAPHRALGPLRPARAAAEIRRRSVPDHLVVGCRPRRPRWDRARDRLCRAADASRHRRWRHSLRARSDRARGAQSGRRRRAARHVGVRRSEISRRLSRISTMSIRTRRRAALFSQIGPGTTTTRTS